MKKSLPMFLFASLLLSGCAICTGNANSKAADWKFTYPGGKLKAVTFSYVAREVRYGHPSQRCPCPCTGPFRRLVRG